MPTATVMRNGNVKGVCATCGKYLEIRRDGKVRTHRIEDYLECPGTDKPPCTDPVRLAAWDAAQRHYPDQFGFCKVCSGRTPPWVSCPCPARTRAWQIFLGVDSDRLVEAD